MVLILSKWSKNPAMPANKVHFNVDFVQNFWYNLKARSLNVIKCKSVQKTQDHVDCQPKEISKRKRNSTWWNMYLVQSFLLSQDQLVDTSSPSEE